MPDGKIISFNNNLYNYNNAKILTTSNSAQLSIYKFSGSYAVSNTSSAEIPITFQKNRFVETIYAICTNPPSNAYNFQIKFRGVTSQQTEERVFVGVSNFYSTWKLGSYNIIYDNNILENGFVYTPTSMYITNSSSTTLVVYILYIAYLA